MKLGGFFTAAADQLNSRVTRKKWLQKEEEEEEEEEEEGGRGADL